MTLDRRTDITGVEMVLEVVLDGGALRRIKTFPFSYQMPAFLGEALVGLIANGWSVVIGDEALDVIDDHAVCNE